MKKLSALIISLLIATMGFAQTQQGYVKTKGRMVDGKLVPGQGLKGATVSVHGRTTVLVNADDGAFSFPVSGAQFRLDSVRKKGYQLVDMDAIGKTYEHSSNPLYLVMETPERQWEDQLAAERKIRRTLTNQLHQREDEIEALKTQQKLSDEEYRQALQKLYEDVDQNEQLVKDMVERYSKIDYDQLSEFDKQISEYILNGELTKADSMLRTKGDINERVSQYKKDEEAIAKEREELSQRQEQLEKSEVLRIKRLEDLANDCYRKFEIFKMRHLNDSAAYYLELRASLNTTNVEWGLAAGRFLFEYIANYNTALYYFNKALDVSQTMYGEAQPNIASCLNSIGSLYCEQGNYDEALDYHNRALSIFKALYGELHPDVASCLNNIGTVYENQGDFVNALDYHKRALSIEKSIFDENNPEIADSYNNIGVVYKKTGEYDKAIENYNKAINIWKSVFGENHPNVAICYNNIGSVYHNQGNYSKALEYFNKALSIQRFIFGDTHPDLAMTYNNMGLVYGTQNNFDKALECHNQSLLILKALFGEIHPNVATSYNNIGMVYCNQGNYFESIDCYNHALRILATIFKEDHPYIPMTIINIGWTYYEQGDITKALEQYNQALSLKNTLGEDHPHVAHLYFNIGLAYEKLGNYNDALKYFNMCLSIRENRLGIANPKTVKTRDKISEIQSKLKEQETPTNE